MPLRHRVSFLLFGDGGSARAASRGRGRARGVAAAPGVARATGARAGAILIHVMGGSLFAIAMAAAIRLERLPAGAVVRMAVTSAASTVTAVISMVAVAVSLVGGTVATAILVGVAADGMASTAGNKADMLVRKAVAIGRALLLALLLLELSDFAIPHVIGVVLGESGMERSDVLLNLVVRLGVLLLVGPRDKAKNTASASSHAIGRESFERRIPLSK
jgi:hypothetical protein